jgi:hypothetical protein
MTMLRFVTLLFSLAVSNAALSITSAEYLPDDADLDPAIPTPESVLGWEVGEWRVSHDQVVKYMEVLAAASDRVSLRVIGYTHERRPLLQLTITSTDNHGNLEALREQHLRSANIGIDHDSKLVIWLGHSIHGNEESGGNSSLLSAYYLAASRSEFVTNLLNDAIILHDPVFNPDGFNRFASWANSNRSKNPVADPNHRVNNEGWPSGRTNHYLFDLNRDWLPLVHPESQARIAEFHRWLPHVLTDQHERGRDGYFYINGSIGILFEQPSMKGPLLERDSGLLKFTDAISNHLRTSLSTLHGSFELQDELRVYQRGFFKSTNDRSRNAGFAAWVVGDDGDPERARAFLNLLDQHQIEYSPLAQDVRVADQEFRSGQAWVLPVQQRQFGLLEGMMEIRTEFEDDFFYDVSAWTQPLAYNLPFAQLSRLPATSVSSSPLPGPAPTDAAVAWIMPWNQLQAATVLQELLEARILVRAAVKPFNANTTSGSHSF